MERDTNEQKAKRYEFYRSELIEIYDLIWVAKRAYRLKFSEVLKEMLEQVEGEEGEQTE